MNNSVHTLAKQYLSGVKPSGNENLMAICPFHRKADGSFERHGSFAMNTTTGLWEYNPLALGAGRVVGRARCSERYAVSVRARTRASPCGGGPSGAFHQ